MAMRHTVPFTRTRPHGDITGGASGTHFPIFVDVVRRAPLVIGDDSGLLAKVRLLLKFAPIVEVITDTKQAMFAAAGERVQVIDSSVATAAAHMAGRPLVILETGDTDRNKTLVGAARALGVPVNVPDNPALSSFYLASLVDRAPVTIAISTMGVAPVLGQSLRARIEDMMPGNYGDLAIYLRGLRDRLRHLPAVIRRRVQHQIIDGPVADNVLAGDRDAADAAVVDLLGAAGRAESDGFTVSFILAAGGADTLSRSAARAIRDADIIFCSSDTPCDLLDLARREVDLARVSIADTNHLAARLAAAYEDGRQAVCLVAGARHQGYSLPSCLTAIHRLLDRRNVPTRYVGFAPSDPGSVTSATNPHDMKEATS